MVLGIPSFFVLLVVVFALEGLGALPTVQEGQAHAGPGRQAARSRPRPLRVQEEIMTFCVRFVFISETRLSLVAWPTELSSCVSTRSRLSFIFDTAHEMADVDVWPCQGTLCTSPLHNREFVILSLI